MTDCFLKIVRTEGTLALFKGMLSPLLGNAPMQAVVFGMNGNANRLIDRWYPNLGVRKDPSAPNYARLYLGGTWAGVGQLSVCVPVELVKCRLQAQISSSANATQQYRGSWDCAVQTLRANGVFRGLYRGFWPTLWRDGPTYGLYFIVYEGTKHHLRREDGSSSLGSMLLAGGLAGIATWLFTYPFDVVKSIVQTLPDNCPREQLTIKYQFSTNYRRYGAEFFVRGLLPCLARAVPANAATFLLYEMTLRVI